jgi:hypothetical protein
MKNIKAWLPKCLFLFIDWHLNFLFLIVSKFKTQDLKISASLIFIFAIFLQMNSKFAFMLILKFWFTFIMEKKNSRLLKYYLLHANVSIRPISKSFTNASH